MIGLLLFDPFGAIGLLFLLVGTIDTLLYGILVAYEKVSIYDWKAWFYPMLFLMASLPFLSISFCNLKRDSQRFISRIKREEKGLERRIRELENGKKAPEVNSSEFGVNNLDIEIEHVVKENGGFVPLVKKDIKESAFSDEQAIKSLAKLSMLEYIHVPQPERKRKDAPEKYIGCLKGVGLKITLTPKGLDALELPRITFATKVPEDISLMMVHARLLYRDGKSHMAILKCYNVLERALKVHLIPTIDGYAEKWDEHVMKKLGKGNEKEMAIYRWKGSATVASLNDLWNFYKKNSNMSRRWSEMTDRVVKYTTREEKEIKQYLDKLSKAEMEQKKEMGRISDRMIDVVADVRSAYAHDKPSAKYDKDAYRILTLTELALGVMFEDFKERMGVKGD